MILFIGLFIFSLILFINGVTKLETENDILRLGFALIFK